MLGPEPLGLRDAEAKGPRGKPGQAWGLEGAKVGSSQRGVL